MRKFIKMMKNSIYGKILATVWKLFCLALEILIVFLAIVIVTQRFTNNQTAFLGIRIFNVATGSMEPEYAVGDILISKEKDPSLIKVGDNIVYLGAQGGYDGKIITHNVIEIEQNEKGEYLFHTKGRANTIEDPIVHEDQLYGTIVHNNKVLAFICRVLLNRYGLYFFVIIPVILYAFVEFIKVQGRKMEEEKEAERERRRIQEEKRAKKQRKLRQLEREEALRLQAEETADEENPIKEPGGAKSRSKKAKSKKVLEEIEKAPKKARKNTSTTKSKKASAEPEEIVEESAEEAEKVQPAKKVRKTSKVDSEEKTKKASSKKAKDK